MELAKHPGLREILRRQNSATSALLQTYAVFASAIVPGCAVFGRVALVLRYPFQLLPRPPARNPEPGREGRGGAVVLYCLFQLSTPRDCLGFFACSLSLFLFRSMLSRVLPALSLLHPLRSLFPLTRSRVYPVPLSVEQAVVQRLSLVFRRNKSARAI